MVKKKKRKLFLIIFLVLGAVFFCFLYLFFQYRKKEDNAQQAVYKAFGVNIPTNYLIYGIDVSSYQQQINWALVKQISTQNIKIGFVFIKATEGLNDTDKFFKTNWQNAAQNNITKGAYHYFLAAKSGEKQAENFIKNVTLSKGDLPPVVDIEELYGQPVPIVKQRLKECLQTLENYYKVKPILYSYANFYETFLGKDFDGYYLWVANYLEKDKPNIKRDWLFWQCTDAATINGIATPTDINIFFADSSKFFRILLK